MTEYQLHQIDQARRYAEQDEYVVTRAHIRNLLAIIEEQSATMNGDGYEDCGICGDSLAGGRACSCLDERPTVEVVNNSLGCTAICAECGREIKNFVE